MAEDVNEKDGRHQDSIVTDPPEDVVRILVRGAFIYDVRFLGR